MKMRFIITTHMATNSAIKPGPKGTLRDRLLSEGLPSKEYFKLENHTFSAGLGIKSLAKSIPVPKDIYETGKLEKEVRKDVLERLRTWGYIARTIYTGGIPIGNGKLGTNPAIGILDTFVIHPIKKQQFWLELKRNSGGKLSPEQQTFIWDVRTSGGTVFVVTSAAMLEKELIAKGFIHVK